MNACALDPRPGDLFQFRTRDLQPVVGRRVLCRKPLLHCLRRFDDSDVIVGKPQLLRDVSGQQPVQIITAQLSVPCRGEHLKGALAHLQHRDVKGAAPQIIHGDLLMLRQFVQPIGQRCSGGLAQDAQHLQPGQFTGAFGGVALRIVEIRWHRDHRLRNGLLQCPLGHRFEML